MERRRTLLVLVGALALAALLAWLWLGPARERSVATPPATASVADEPARAALAFRPALEEEARAARERAPVAAEEALVEAPAEPPPAAALPARDALGAVDLLVQDRFGAAIANAEGRVWGLRSADGPGAHYGIGDAMTPARSDVNGALRLAFPEWAADRLRTSTVSLTLRHPEYETTTLDLELARDEPEAPPRVVVMQRGSFLVVSGWIGEPERVVLDVEPALTDGAPVEDDSWVRLQDGRWSNATVPPGVHALWLRHRDAEGRVWFSETHGFQLAREEQKELHVELLPARRLEGRLDREVPRPVENGRVLLQLSVREPGTRAVALRPFRAEVDADGAFTLPDLPPGDGEILAQCDGWVTERRRKTLEDLGVAFADAEERASLEQQLEAQLWAPLVIDPAAVEGVYELAMEPCARLEARVLDPEGRPIEGAQLDLWPNVFWRTGSSQLFLSRHLSARSDGGGRLVVENLPTGYVGYGMQHDGLVLPENASGFRSGALVLSSGESATLTLELVRVD